MNLKRNVSASRFFLLGGAVISLIAFILSVIQLNMKVSTFGDQNISDFIYLLMMLGIGLFLLGLISLFLSRLNKMNDLEVAALEKQNPLLTNASLIVITIMALALFFLSVLSIPCVSSLNWSKIINL